MRVTLIVFLFLAALLPTSEAEGISFLSAELTGQVKVPTIPSVPVPKAPTAPAPPTPKVSESYKRLAEMMTPTYQDFEESRPVQTQKEQDRLEETILKALDEFGPRARFAATDHFIFIYDTNDHFAQWVALICERVETTYEKFVYNSGLGQIELTAPMIVFIYAHQQDYEDYAKKNFTEYASLKNKPIGFYASEKNRIALYDMTGIGSKPVEDPAAKRSLEEVATEILTQPKGMETLSAIVHETTHMVSYNRGLFSRTGKNPTWALEGLAMLLEAPVGEIEDGGWNVTVDFGPNKSRIAEFQRYVKSTKENALYKIITSETINGDVPGSYEISWALFSYLYKKYPNRLARYLYETAGMQPRESYPVADRALEFAACFTDEYDKLYAELCAFVDELEKNPDSFMTVENKNKKGKKTENGKKDEDNKKEPDAEKDDVPNDNGGKEPEKQPDVKDKLEEAPKEEEDVKPDNPPEPIFPESEPDLSAPKPIFPESEEPEKLTIAIEGLTINGEVFNWSKYAGKYVLVNFWASWSRTSVEEVERLIALYAKYHDAGLEFVGYSLDDDVDTLKDFVAKRKLEWPILSQSLSCEANNYEDMSERYDVYSLPKAILVGKDGRALAVGVQGEALEQELQALFPGN